MIITYKVLRKKKKIFSLLWYVSLCVHLMIRRWGSRTISGVCVSGCHKVNQAMTALTTFYSAPGTVQCLTICGYLLWERVTTLTSGLRSACLAPTTKVASGDPFSASHLRRLSVHNHKDRVPSSNNELALLECKAIDCSSSYLDDAPCKLQQVIQSPNAAKQLVTNSMLGILTQSQT